jgi:Asp-tRNA(Asn)/Glu-tRNA(Gln) amidotransferase C subunit
MTIDLSRFRFSGQEAATVQKTVEEILPQCQTLSEVQAKLTQALGHLGEVERMLVVSIAKRDWRAAQ